MSKPKIGDFSLNNLNKPVVQLDARDGTVKCRYVMHLEIDGIIYVVDRADKLAVLMLTDVQCGGVNPEKWKEDEKRNISSDSQDLNDIGHLETRVANDFRDGVEHLQDLENEYPEGILEQAPWKSGEIRLSRGNSETDKVVTVAEFKRRHDNK